MHLNIGFSDFSDDELADHANAIVVALTGNTSFPSPTPTLATVTMEVTALRNAVALPQGPGRGGAITTARAALVASLQQLAQNLEATPNVPASAWATTGYRLPKARTRATTPPPAPGNVRLLHGPNPGEVLGKCDPSEGARAYEGEWTLDPINGPWTDGGTFPSTFKIVLNGLPRGKDVWIRLRALGTAGFSPWSDPATIMVT